MALLPQGPGGSQAQGVAASAGGKPGDAAPPKLFQGWGKPDVAIVLSGEERGYLQPCGCSRPQYGGLARRYNFMQSLRQRGWQVVAADLGDIAQRSGPQKMLKYETAMKALDLLGYSAVGIGQNEIGMPLVEALAHYALNNPSPRVLAANLLDRAEGGLYQGMVDSWTVAPKDKTPQVGIAGLIGPSVANLKKDPSVRLQPNKTAIKDQLLPGLKAKKVDLVVLLYQGSLDEAKAAATFAAECRRNDPSLPAIDVILCLYDDEPPGTPDRVGRTHIVRLGQKGRYVGVIGAFGTGQPQLPFELRYQLVAVGEEYETPPGKERDNPLMALMEDYAQEVKRGNYLAQYPRSVHPLQLLYPDAKYVGSQACAECHEHATKVWQNSAHAHAYAKLEKAVHPSLRQYDGECVTCHVVGFGYRTGFTDEVKTGHLKDVGCESCHGPGSAHIEKTRDRKVRALMNPWKGDPARLARAKDQAERDLFEHQRSLQIDKFCQSCHDIDNDVHWKFDKYWPKIMHTTPRAGQGAAPAPQQPPDTAEPDQAPAPQQADPKQSRFRLFRRPSNP